MSYAVTLLKDRRPRIDAEGRLYGDYGMGMGAMPGGMMGMGAGMGGYGMGMGGMPMGY